MTLGLTRDAPGQRVALRHLIWLIAAAASLVITARVSLRLFRVKGLSMEPALQDGQLLLIDTLTYRWLHPPRYGDIIVFRDPRRRGRDVVKRVIAVPGETVQIAGGLIHINGRPRCEPFTSLPGWFAWGPQTVPTAHYFVLGDNQNASKDSLSWGFLPTGYVIGKVRQRSTLPGL